MTPRDSVQHRFLAAALFALFAASVLFAVDATATCSSSVNASVSGTTLTITATSSGACGGAGGSVAIDGNTIGTFSCPTNSCTRTWTLSSACYRTGSHTVTATASCNRIRSNSDGTTSCVGDTPGNSSSSFSVNTTPTVSVSHAKLDDLGNGTMTVPYSFPNTEGYWQRWIGIYVDGNLSWTHRPSNANGSWVFEADTTCWSEGTHTIDAVAVACDAWSDSAYRAENSTSISVTMKPTVSVSHARLDDLGNGTMTVPYHFPNTQGYWQRWIGIYVDGNLTWSHRPSNNNGSWVFEADTTCWGEGTHTITAIAVACDAWSNPGYRDEKTTTIAVTMKPTVSVSHAKLDDLGNGTMTVPYHFPNTQGYWQRWIGIYVNGNLTWSTRPSNNNGTWVFEADTTCWGEGTHTITAIAVACDAWSNAGYRDEKTTTIAVTMKPTVSVSHATLDDLGNGTMTVPYHFPNTQGYWQRWIGIYVDGNLAWSTRPSNNNGTWTFEADTTCWSEGTHTITAIAVSCDAWSNAGYRDEDTTTIEVTMKPTVSVSHTKLDDLGNGTMTVPYHFPNTQGYWQRWIGIYVNGSLTWSTRPSNNSGTWTFEADTTCWGEGTHTITAIAVSCDAWSNAGYRDEKTTTIAVTMKPTVSVSHAKLDNLGNGTMTVGYHFPNTQGYWQRWIGVYVDGNLAWSTRPSNNAGNWVFEADTTCWSDGPHVITAIAVACDAWSNPGYRDEKTTTITVKMKPEVSLQIAGPDLSGRVTLTIPYNFPNTQGYWQRWLAVYVDGVEYRSTRPSAVSGTWVVDVNAACVRPRFKAVAVSCDRWSDPTYRDEDEQQLSETQTKPTVSVSHTGPDAAGVYQVPVTWSFPGPGARHIDVYQNGILILAFDPATASGTRILSVTGCGEIEAIAVACGRPGDPAFTGRSQTFLPPDGCKEDRDFCSYSGPAGGPPSGAMGNRAGPTAAGRPVNVGSGDVSVTIPLFTMDSPALPLALVFEYHSAQPIYRSLASEIAPGWSHTFSGTMRPIDASANLLYRTTASGRETIYQRAGGDTWVAIRPREIEETVTLSGGAYRVTALDGSSVTFDQATGRLTSTSDRWGNAITASYDASGNLTSLTDADGRVITVNAIGTAPSSITLPDGATWRFTYASGNLSAIHDPLHTGATPWRTFEYSNDRRSVPRLMTAMRDDAGALLEGHTYDAQERGTSSFVGANREKVTFQYNVPSAGQTRVTHEIDAGVLQTYDVTLLYQPGKYLPVVSTGSCATCGGGSGGTETRQYDASNRVTQWVDGEGNTTLYSYDANGNVLTVTRAAGTPLEHVTTYEYNDPSWPSFATKMTEPSATGSGTRVTERQFNADQSVLTVTESGKLNASTAVSRTSTTTFDGRHRVIAEDGPRSDVADVATATYHPVNDPDVNRRGRLATSVNAAGHVTTFESYDVFGNSLRVIDANGAVHATETDARGRTARTSRTGAPPDTTTYVDSRVYDSRDRLASFTDPRGSEVRFTYEDGSNWNLGTTWLNPAGEEVERVLRTLNGMGRTTREELQECSNPASTCLTWSTKHTKSFVYDSEAHLSRMVAADGAAIVYSYDENGRLETMQDETHTAPNVTYSYDARGRMTTVTQTLGSGSAVTRYAHDTQDNLTSVIDPNGNVTAYEFDDFGRMQRQVSPVTGITTYTYDPAGNLLESSDANGATTVRIYDVIGRPRSFRSSRGGAPDELVEWTFDGAAGIGRLASTTDPTGTTAFAYDGHGRVISESKTIEGTTYTTAFEHDGNGNRTAITYPSGVVATYTYDFAGRPKTLHYGATPIVTDATYLPFGPISRIVFGNGTTQEMTHDTRYRMTANTLRSSSATLASYALGYDPAGNITSISDSIDPSYDRAFTYDDLHRLTTATTGAALWGNGAYTYDPMGNILSSAIGAKTNSFSYSGTSPRLLSVNEDGSSRNVTYDAAGNETGVGSTSMAYSPRNQLVAAGQVAYRYDGSGLRVITTYPAVLAAISVTPPTLYTNQSGTGTVTLDAPADTGGILVTLSSSSPGAIVPASVTIAEGTTEVSFPIALAEPVVPGTVTITATRGISRSATLVIVAGPPLASVTVTPATVVGGASASVSVALSAPAPAGGALVRLSSDSPNVVVPADLTVPEGTTTATGTVTTSAVAMTTTATITALYGNSTTANLELQPLAVDSVSVPASIIGGQATTGTVVLNGPAPAGGALVALTSSHSAATVPTNVTVPESQTTATFPITTAPQTATVNATITAQYNGSSASAAIAVTPCTPVRNSATIPEGDTVFVDDALPPGAMLQGGYGMVFWDDSQSAGGSRSLSNGGIATGLWESYIAGLNEPLHIGENAVAYFRVNECAVPREIRISWDGGGTGHVYWGEALMENNGIYMGPVPTTGEWVRVEIPLAQMDLEVRTLGRIRLAHYDGQVWYDHFGKSGIACLETRELVPSMPDNDTVFVDDSVPPPAMLQGGFGIVHWDADQSAGGAQSLTNAYHGPSARFESYISFLNEPLHIGENHVAYFRVNECAVPREIRISWDAGNAEHVYWGEPLMENNGLYMGPVPTTGGWVRVQVPLRQLDQEKRILGRIRMAYWGGQVWFDRFGKTGTPCIEPTEPQPVIPPGDTVFVDDALPPGASLQGGFGIVQWDTSQWASGSQSLANGYHGPDARHESYIAGLNEPLHIGENVVAYFRVDECAVPREVRLTWDAGGAAHIYWGEPLMENNGIYMGPVPTTGDWVRVEVPLSQLDLEQRTLTRIRLAHYGGQVWFDRFGKSGTPCFEATEPQPAIPAGDIVFVDDTLPAGASLQGGFGIVHWDSSQWASGSQSLVNSYHGPNARAESYIAGLNETLGSLDSVVAYFRVNECAVPREIRLSWDAGNTGHIYWGEPLMDNNGLYMGPVPTTGDWVRVEVRASQLGLPPQAVLTRIRLAHYGGQVWFDRFGKACIAAPAPPPTIPAGETIWVDDSVPAGAQLQNGYHGPIHWDASQKATGTQALVNHSFGAVHYESYINGLDERMEIGERVVAYFMINECATTPREIQLAWDTNKGTYRAFWGEALVGGENDAVNMGPIPAAGQWVRVELPGSPIVEQANISRIRLIHHGGQVWFDRLGKTGTPCIEAAVPPPALVPGDTIWVDDSVPAGAELQNGYHGPIHWDPSQKASGAQALVNNWWGAVHYESYVNGLNERMEIGERVVAHFMINECAIPREIQLAWDTNKGTYRAFWGEALVGGENDAVNMGPIPAAGQWVRVELPGSPIVEQATISRIRLIHHGGQVWFDRLGKTGTPCIEAAAPPPALVPGDTVWVDDSVPAGAELRNGYHGPIHWDPSQKASGAQGLVNNWWGAVHYESYVNGLAERMEIGERVVAHFMINECAIPREIQLAWDTDRGTHRAFWGEALVGGENDAVNMGPIPAAGQWIRVELPSAPVVEQVTVRRIRLIHHGGQVWFDRLGKTGMPCIEAPAPPPALVPGDTIWVDDTVPAGAQLQNGYHGPIHWDSSQQASGTQSLVNYWSGALHYESYVTDMTETLQTGDRVVAYFMINECLVPREIKLTWDTNKGSHHVYWGEALMGGEGDATNMGPIPAAGGWIRVEVPATPVLEQATLSRIRIAHHGGQVWFDRFGKLPAIAPAVLTGFSASHASPQPAGTTITWTATAAGSVMPLEYRFEREHDGEWSVVQPYSTVNTYTWTPTAADAGTHTIRVAVRNGGSLSSFDDLATSTMTITSTSGLFQRTSRSFFARLRDRFTTRTPVSLGVASRPVSTATNPRRRYSFYSPDLHLLAQTAVTTAASPAIEHEILWFDGAPVAQVDRTTGATQWTFTDHLGAPILQTDASATVTWRVEREPYGTVYATRAGADRHQPLGFPGQESDSAVPELAYNIFRWYRSAWGRYTQADPIGLNGGPNLYAYAGGQPTGQADPYGLFTIPRDRLYDKCRTLRKGYAQRELDRVRREPRCRNFFRNTCNSDLDRLFNDPLPRIQLVPESRRSSGGAFDSNTPDVIYISMRECKSMEDFSHTLIHELGHYGDYHNNNDSISDANHSDGCRAEIECFGFTRSMNCKDRGFQPYRPPKR